MSDKQKLKTLDEHNAEYMSYHTAMYDNRPQKNGIACPNCENELLDTNPFTTLTSNPPKKNVHCDNCGYVGYRIA